MTKVRKSQKPRKPLNPRRNLLRNPARKILRQRKKRMRYPRKKRRIRIEETGMDVVNPRLLILVLRHLEMHPTWWRQNSRVVMTIVDVTDDRIDQIIEALHQS